MKTYLVLENGTIGALWDGIAEVGQIVTVKLYNENGDVMYVTGTVKVVIL